MKERGYVYVDLAELGGMETFALLNLLQLVQTFVYHRVRNTDFSEQQ